jgi:hypothetical protein
MTTRIRPIRPAIRPFSSCSEPSVAEICSSLCTWKLSGSAPNFSWLASAVAESRVNEPEISALPSEMMTPGSSDGAEMTRPSSTIANWFCGEDRPCSRSVTSANWRVPVRSNSRFTAQLFVTAPDWLTWRPELAFAMCEPSTSTGPRMYLTVPSGSQVTIAASAATCLPPVRLAGSVQSRASYSAWTAGVM